MDKLINKKVENYITEFKNNIRNKVSELNIDEKTKVNDLLEYVYDYQRLTIMKEDLVKRKRIKNSIPVNNRCGAKRANGEQCTRRRKDESEYCGTHMKGIPHGCLNVDDENTRLSEKKVEVIAEEVFGIIYYIDNENNVYKTEDVLNGDSNPTIIAKCIKENGKTTIPELGLI
jgi:hypothetical protein